MVLDRAQNRALDRAAQRASGSGTSGGGLPAGWAPAGYSALFETVAPSSIALDTVPDPDEVVNWTDSTGNLTAVNGNLPNRPTFPHPNTVGGFDGIGFFQLTSANYLDVAMPVVSTDHYAMFFVLLPEQTGAANDIFAAETGGVDNIEFRIIPGGAIRHFRDGSNHLSSASLTGSTAARLMVAWEGTNSIIRLEGSAEESAALGAGSFAGNSCRFGGQFSATRPYDGGLYLAVIYGGASGIPGSAVSRQAVWDAIGTRFSL